MIQTDAAVDRQPGSNKTAKAMAQVAGLLRGPHRVFPLLMKLASDGVNTRIEQRNLYSYAATAEPSNQVLRSLVRWMTDAQAPDGGIPAYYGLLDGYSEPYPEVTGYIVPTLYDFSALTGDTKVREAAERATKWLLALQMPSGAFPGGLHGDNAGPSVFNTGQILQGLVRAAEETRSPQVLEPARAAGDWLVEVQQEDGSWAGSGAYQGNPHTYYSMVAWALARLSEVSSDGKYGEAAARNIDWVIGHMRPSGWFDGINLEGHLTYLHFIAYVIQGVLEFGIVERRNDAMEAVRKPALTLLRRFETTKHLSGAYEQDFRGGANFTCLTGNAQMSCVWLRLFEVTGDPRYLNAALKMNEKLKRLIPQSGRRGVLGGVAGSYPIWGAYQPLRYISWGCKFLADALMLEQRLTRVFEVSACGS